MIIIFQSFFSFLWFQRGIILDMNPVDQKCKKNGGRAHLQWVGRSTQRKEMSTCIQYEGSYIVATQRRVTGIRKSRNQKKRGKGNQRKTGRGGRTAV